MGREELICSRGMKDWHPWYVFETSEQANVKTHIPHP